jgi:hypothetical protein
MVGSRTFPRAMTASTVHLGAVWRTIFAIEPGASGTMRLINCSRKLFGFAHLWVLGLNNSPRRLVQSWNNGTPESPV